MNKWNKVKTLEFAGLTSFFSLMKIGHLLTLFNFLFFQMFSLKVFVAKISFQILNPLGLPQKRNISCKQSLFNSKKHHGNLSLSFPPFSSTCCFIEKYFQINIKFLLVSSLRVFPIHVV